MPVGGDEHPPPGRGPRTVPARRSRRLERRSRHRAGQPRDAGWIGRSVADDHDPAAATAEPRIAQLDWCGPARHQHHDDHDASDDHRADDHCAAERAHPITILDIGDSIGEDLGIGLGDVLGSDPAVKVIQSAVGNTGLADPGYYNWPANLAGQLKQYHPKIVVVMLGGNDWQPFLTGPNTAAIPGTAYWRSAYGQRVAGLINEATSAGAAVFWVGLPPMAPSSALPPAMSPALNAVFQAQAAANGATYVPTWNAFTNAAGQYAEFLPNAEGQLVAVRDPDGVHLAPPAGCDLAATIVRNAIQSTFDIKL